jgi:hypothetical protein
MVERPTNSLSPDSPPRQWAELVVPVLQLAYGEDAVEVGRHAHVRVAHDPGQGGQVATRHEVRPGESVPEGVRVGSPDSPGPLSPSVERMRDAALAKPFSSSLAT